jgi:DNA-binding NarL/FixJ family response regulator
LLQRNDMGVCPRSCWSVRNTGAGRLRVLVADDSDLMQRAVVRLLQDAFEIVDVVSTGRELVEAARALNPDVIVSDFSMPSLSGAEALKALSESGHAVPFVLMTATVRNVQNWIDLGALCVVDKADVHLELVTAVRSAAAGKVYLSRSVTGSGC